MHVHVCPSSSQALCVHQAAGCWVPLWHEVRAGLAGSLHQRRAVGMFEIVFERFQQAVRTNGGAHKHLRNLVL